MSRKRFKKVGFYFGLFEKRIVPDIYQTLFHKEDQKPIYKSNLVHSNAENIEWYVKLFPSYLDFEKSHRPELELKKFFRVQGFAINLNVDSSDEYLRTHFKPNFRTALRRRLKGLETCFNIRYVMYHGHMEREEYEFIMQNLHTMLVRRFTQRNDKNMVLNRWDDYHRDTLGLINQKKASLFVIYDNSKPIQISLSYHFDHIFFLAIPSYDIDYAKFGLGNLAIKYLLEWCIENSYVMLDMGYGAFDYKVKWCNTTYNFDHHLFYKKSSIISRLIVGYITLKTRFINFLLAKNVNVLYNRFKNLLLGKKKVLPIRYTIIEDSFDKKELVNFTPIDPISNDMYGHLRKSLYDFAYTGLEKVSSIKIYEAPNKKEYCFVGTGKIQKIILES